MSQTSHTLIEPILRATEEYGERERERLGRLGKAAAAVRLHHHNRHPWAQPGDEPHRVWILRFSDQDVGDMVWTGADAEANARAAYAQHSSAWTCYLFATAPAFPNPSDHQHPGEER